MHFFHYRDGELYCEDVDLARVAKEFGTPTYVYSAGTILDHYARLDAALAPLDHLICYAVKGELESRDSEIARPMRAPASTSFPAANCYRVLAAGGDPAQLHVRGSGQIA